MRKNRPIADHSVVPFRQLRRRVTNELNLDPPVKRHTMAVSTQDIPLGLAIHCKLCRMKPPAFATEFVVLASADAFVRIVMAH